MTTIKGLRWVLAVAISALATSLPAQDPAEQAFLKKQAGSLDAFAKFAFDQGFPQHARRIWQEVLKEYDADDADARRALGYRRVGTAWQEIDGFAFPFANNARKDVLAKVERKWSSTAKEVGLAHKAKGEEFQAAGRSDRATWHFERALRFLPDEPSLQEAAGLKSFYGMRGTELEHQLYGRSKKMKDIAEAERKKTYEVQTVEEKDPFLEKAGIPYKAWKTEHYTLLGNLGDALMQEIAMNFERSHSFCSQIFIGAEGFNDPGLRVERFAFLESEGQYRKVLEANSDQFNPQLLKFLLENTAMCPVGKGKEKVKLCGDPTVDVVRDLSIRWPVDAWGAMRSDGLNEGLGHAVVALFQGRITVFQMDLERQEGTASQGEPGKTLVPDISSWRDLAIESAFKDRGVPLGKLPLIDASNFTSDARVRAWSFCDYLLRRDPRLLLELDKARGAKSPPEVEAAFQQATGVSLKDLAVEWRNFWTGATPVLQALRGGSSPYDVSSKDADKWLKEFNKQRKKLGVPGSQVVWHAGWSVHCMDHALYLRDHKAERGPECEQTEKADLSGATTRGSFFAQMALVSTKGSPSSAMKQWIHWPGYRDALLNPNLMQVGLFAENGIAVFDVVRGVVPPSRGNAVAFPADGSKGVPAGIDLDDLGPEAARLLEGKSPGKKVGYPITLHDWGRVPGKPTCTVTVGGEPVDGVLHYGSQGYHRRTSAPGMAVFLPVKPLKKGPVTVVWRDGRGQELKVTFTTK